MKVIGLTSTAILTLLLALTAATPAYGSRSSTARGKTQGAAAGGPGSCKANPATCSTAATLKGSNSSRNSGPTSSGMTTSNTLSNSMHNSNSTSSSSTRNNSSNMPKPAVRSAHRRSGSVCGKARGSSIAHKTGNRIIAPGNNVVAITDTASLTIATADTLGPATDSASILFPSGLWGDTHAFSTRDTGSAPSTRGRKIGEMTGTTMTTCT